MLNYKTPLWRKSSQCKHYRNGHHTDHTQIGASAAIADCSSIFEISLFVPQKNSSMYPRVPIDAYTRSDIGFDLSVPTKCWSTNFGGLFKLIVAFGLCVCGGALENNRHSTFLCILKSAFCWAGLVLFLCQPARCPCSVIAFSRRKRRGKKERSVVAAASLRCCDSFSSSTPLFFCKNSFSGCRSSFASSRCPLELYGLCLSLFARFPIRDSGGRGVGGAKTLVVLGEKNKREGEGYGG